MTILSLIYIAIFAMLPLHAKAHGLRLKRISPLIDVTVGGVRQIVDPLSSFMIKRDRQEEDETIPDEQEVIGS
jgi:hypothetical protein